MFRRIVHPLLVISLLAGCGTSGSVVDEPTEVLGEPPDEQRHTSPRVRIEVRDVAATEAPRSRPLHDSPLGTRRISIDLHEADVRKVLGMLAQEADVNIVLADGVSGAVTLQLRNATLDDVFYAVLASQGLAWERRGNIVLLTPP